MTRLALGLTVVLGLLTSPAWAQVARFPTSSDVSVFHPSTVTINWLLTNATGRGVSTSTVGFFLLADPGTTAASCAAATAIGRVDTTLTTALSASGTARAVETLVVPFSVADRVAKLKRSQFFYCRVFSGFVVAPSASNRVTLRPGSGASAGLSISRVELFFENRRGEITIPLGQPDFRVFADIAYRGSGVLRAVWEVGEGGASSQSLLFRTLHVINDYVPFGDRILLTLPGAPPLPTSQPGTYAVQLRFVDPSVPFTVPVVRYFVEAREHPQRSQPIALRAPAETATLAFKPFHFQWEGISKLAQYRLDIYPQETPTRPSFPGLTQGPAAAEAVLSVLIPPQATAFTLTGRQFAKLAASGTYLWQVKGLDSQGTVVAESALRQFTLQPRPVTR